MDASLVGILPEAGPFLPVSSGYELPCQNGGNFPTTSTASSATGARSYPMVAGWKPAQPFYVKASAG